MTSPRSFLFSLEQIGIKLGLEQIRTLVAALDFPHKHYQSIIVAGTNGKGSVTAMIERGLRSAGYRTGRYTSPHLVRLEERVAIDGTDISPLVLDAAAERVREASRSLPHPPSFFEATTALALDVFRDAAVDIAVLEVGMGGRLDATNVVDPMAAAITLVDFDHEQYLGHTLEAIAYEKAGVIKRDMLVVLADNPPAVDAVVAEACAAAGAPMVRASAGVSSSATMVDGRTLVELTTSRMKYAPLHLALRGRHQVSNALTAIRLLEEMTAEGLVTVPSDAIRTAVEDVVWPARLELIAHGGHTVLIDGAHNPSGARALATYINDTYRRPLPFVVGVMQDKQVDGILAALAPVASRFVFVAAGNARAADPAELMARGKAIVPRVPSHCEVTPFEGVRYAERFGTPVVVAGSLYLAGEIRAELS